MMDFFKHPVTQQLLPYIHHMEHGIKVTKTNVITYKFNFGVILDDVELIKQSLVSVEYPKHTISEIIHYITTSSHPYSGFGIEDDKIEFYVESNQVIRSWNLYSNVQFIYKYATTQYAYSMLEKHLKPDMFQLCRIMIGQTLYIYNKTLYNSNEEGDLFNFYFKKANPPKTAEITGELKRLLSMLNKDRQIGDYLHRYSTWYFMWLHISMKRDGSLQITPYFRSKLPKILCHRGPFDS